MVSIKWGIPYKGLKGREEMHGVNLHAFKEGVWNKFQVKCAMFFRALTHTACPTPLLYQSSHSRPPVKSLALMTRVPEWKLEMLNSTSKERQDAKKGPSVKAGNTVRGSGRVFSAAGSDKTMFSMTNQHDGGSPEPQGNNFRDSFVSNMFQNWTHQTHHKRPTRQFKTKGCSRKCPLSPQPSLWDHKHPTANR